MSKLAACAVALVFAVLAPAEVRSETPPASAATEKPVNPALFVARDENSTIYLFGTVHLRRPGAAWGGANAQAALAEADEVWTELEITPEADAAAARLLWQHGMAPPHEPLSSVLNESERARLAAAATSLNLPPQMLERMRPWLAGMTLSLLPMMRDGYDPSAGVDNMIDAVADAAGKRRRAFETAEQQVQFFAGMSMEAQRELLVEALAQFETEDLEVDVLADAWARGDIEGLEREVIDETRSRYPEMFEVMLVQRNDAWVAMLMQELEGSGVDFVAVGAAHLLGREGLVEQLRARGVSVERVSPAE
jgi:uncharacterized protein